MNEDEDGQIRLKSIKIPVTGWKYAAQNDGGMYPFDRSLLTDVDKAELILKGICIDCGGKLPEHRILGCYL